MFRDGKKFMLTVLRVGHRIGRDKRITTHVCLVARAFGADKVIIDTKDEKIEENIVSTTHRFGGNFQIKTGVKNVKKFIKNWDGLVVHLTMYGEKLKKTVEQIDKEKNCLVIIGAEKVPAYIYDLADFNVSVGNQPHSEVAALALFLDRYFDGKWIDQSFDDAEMVIKPCKNGKKVESFNKKKGS